MIPFQDDLRKIMGTPIAHYCNTYAAAQIVIAATVTDQ